MRKIFEFKVFDILQDKENVKFLDKVKKENFELYTKFLNLIGNKGLDVAKQKYEEFDPEYKKRMNEIEKEINKNLKKIDNKKYKEKENERILNEYKSEIEEIEEIIYSSELYNVDSYIYNDKNISKYFNDSNIKTKNSNDFDKLLKSPSNLGYELWEFFHTDTILYELNKINIYNKNTWILKIHQYYNLSTKELKYSIHFDTDIIDEYYTPNIDKSKNPKFINYRNSNINKLSKYTRIDIDMVYETLGKYSNMLSDKYYNDWKVINDTSKYNI